MGRSKDFRKYMIVTKTPNYTFWHTDSGQLVEPNDVEFTEERDKTFWMFEKDTGELVGRYSVKSAPQWIMEIYGILTNETEGTRNVE